MGFNENLHIEQVAMNIAMLTSRSSVVLIFSYVHSSWIRTCKDEMMVEQAMNVLKLKADTHL